jgi:streptogramin lyase
VFRIDPEANRAVDRVPVDAPSGVAFGFGSVWAVSAGHGTLSRIDPETGEVAERMRVGRGAADVAVDERSGAVWVAGLYLSKDPDGGDSREHPKNRKLSRVDPRTNRVVAEIPIRAGTPSGGAQSVAVGGGAVWATSVDGRLLKVDPETNEVVANVALGDYSSDLKFSGGSVWVTGQDRSGVWLKQVDPHDGGLRVVWSRGLGAVDSGGYGRLAADGAGRVWFVEGGSGTGKLTRVSP